jgi:hypothetical protein
MICLVTVDSNIQFTNSAVCPYLNCVIFFGQIVNEFCVRQSTGPDNCFQIIGRMFPKSLQALTLEGTPNLNEVWTKIVWI